MFFDFFVGGFRLYICACAAFILACQTIFYVAKGESGSDMFREEAITIYEHLCSDVKRWITKACLLQYLFMLCILAKYPTTCPTTSPAADF